MASGAGLRQREAQPRCIRVYPGQEVGGARWPAEGFGDGGAEQQDGRTGFRGCWPG